MLDTNVHAHALCMSVFVTVARDGTTCAKNAQVHHTFPTDLEQQSYDRTRLPSDSIRPSRTRTISDAIIRSVCVRVLTSCACEPYTLFEPAAAQSELGKKERMTLRCIQTCLHTYKAAYCSQHHGPATVAFPVGPKGECPHADAP